MFKIFESNNGIFPKMNFLTKDSQRDVPLRPIVSFIGSPIYNISKWIAEIFTYAFEKDEKYVRYSFEFTDFIRDQAVSDNYVLISLNGVSLFANIPLDLTINIVGICVQNQNNYLTVT